MAVHKKTVLAGQAHGVHTVDPPQNVAVRWLDKSRDAVYYIVETKNRSVSERDPVWNNRIGVARVEKASEEVPTATEPGDRRKSTYAHRGHHGKNPSLLCRAS